MPRMWFLLLRMKLQESIHGLSLWAKDWKHVKSLLLKILLSLKNGMRRESGCVFGLQFHSEEIMIPLCIRSLWKPLIILTLLLVKFGNCHYVADFKVFWTNGRTQEINSSLSSFVILALFLLPLNKSEQPCFFLIFRYNF